MQLPVLNEPQRNMLQAVLHKGSMTPDQLAELCKNAFGWSAAVIRRTQKSLLKQGLLQEQDGLLTPTITKEDLESNLWDSRLQDAFEWTPPEQPQVATKTPFYKNLWFWTTCVALVVITILCITLFTPSSPVSTTTNIPPELLVCKEALDQWQAEEAQQFFHITEIPNAEVPLASYCFYKNNWMQLCWDPQNPYSTEHLSYMHRDGQLFISDNAVNVIYWKPTNLEYTITATPWPMTFSWENCQLDYLDTTVSGKETHILFQVTELSAENTSTYKVTFIFDQAQNLKTIIKTTEVSTAQSSGIRSDTYHLQECNPADVAKLFADAIIQVPNDETPAIPEELLVCREALDKWQAHDIYNMEHTIQYQMNPTNGNDSLIYHLYYVHKYDWLHLCSDLKNPESTDHRSYMYWDGKLFVTDNLLDPIWTDTYNDHLPAPQPWPMTFNWEDCELYHQKTIRYNYGTQIRFLIIDRSENTPAVYEVEFAMDNFKNLYYIEVTSFDAEKKICTETYVMVTTDSKEIQDAIISQANPVIPQPPT